MMRIKKGVLKWMSFGLFCHLGSFVIAYVLFHVADGG